MAFRRYLQFFSLFLICILSGNAALFAQAQIESDGIGFARSAVRLKTNDDQGRQLSQEAGSRTIDIKSAPASPLSSEFPPPKYKTSGREFYVVFPSVKGSGSSQINPAKRSIYISSRSRTKVRISYIHRQWMQEVTAVPGQMTIVELPSWGLLNSKQFDDVFDLGFLIEAQDDIAVYGYSHEILSSDGFLILPKESLGQHYIVASMRNAMNYGDYTSDYYPRSTFVVMATEDNTSITLKLTATSQSKRLLKDSEYVITLNRGEVFPVMARDTGIWSSFKERQWFDDTTYVEWDVPYVAAIVPGHDPDLTGSEVKADKPVAVFCGHERAASPPSIEVDITRLLDTATGVSRDHLIEQVPPVELWGNEFIVMGSAQDREMTRPANGDLIRVISAEDDNQVTVNGVLVGTANARGYVQFFNPDLSRVSTSKPALVLKYSQSRAFVRGLGDPDMTIVPPMSNLSMKYTLPVVNNNAAFDEEYVNVLVHKDAINSTLINGRAPYTRPKAIPGTNFVWYTEWGAPGEWRIESSLPCYAESYAYGGADSYTFAGGGDFNYQDSLFAQNLDFKTILISKSKDLTSNIRAGYDLNLLADSVTVHNITWLSGDTEHFELLDPITTPVRLGPGDVLPVRYRFTPTEVREYRAKAWVWSSSRAIVTIELVGKGGLMSVDITPPIINFGRVRVGKSVDSIYAVRFYGDDRLAKIELLQRDFSELASEPLGFHIDDIESYFGEGGTAYTAGIVFTPMTEGYRDTVMKVFAVLPQNKDVSETLEVRLQGRGIEPNVVTQDRDYGEVRTGRETNFEDIEIRNIGSDTTFIRNIRFESGDVEHFALDPATLPGDPIFLDTTDVSQSRYRFRAKFTPKDTGDKRVVVRIETLDQEVIYSTLTGRGVEPYIIATPDTINFGTIVSPAWPAPAIDPVDTFRITNIGTYEAIVERLQQTTGGAKHFTLRPIEPRTNVLNEPVAKKDFIDVEVTFDVNEVGEYSDVVSVLNDTKNQPIVVLLAKVVADSVMVPPLVLFDTVRDCDPIIDSILIQNPNSVGIEIDSIRFVGQTAGFSYAENFLFPIKIPAGGSYPLKIKYEFPRDSLSGDQKMTLKMYQMVGDQLVSFDVVLHIVRQIRTLVLETQAPSFVPNASDTDPFRLPIRIVGDHFGLPELDNFDLVLRFNNELFIPTGYDLVGSLMENPQASGGFITTAWNEEEKTYTISANSMQVSQRKGDLLITILMRARLTKDTTAIVIPELALTDRPCAYGVEKLGTDLYYADDCGDIRLRDILVNGNQTFSIRSAHPDPLVTVSSSAINFGYELATNAMLECEVIDATGRIIERLEPISAAAGEGTLVIPASKLDASGVYTLRVVQRLSTGGTEVTTRNFRVVR
jgi:hypothetical protein